MLEVNTGLSERILLFEHFRVLRRQGTAQESGACMTNASGQAECSGPNPEPRGPRITSGTEGPPCEAPHTGFQEHLVTGSEDKIGELQFRRPSPASRRTDAAHHDIF
jgi:hypothetical protein